MKLSIFLYFVILLLVSFTIMKRKLHLLENIFLYIIVVFVMTTYSAALYVNSSLWEISVNKDLFVIFRIYQAFGYPFIWILFFNGLPGRETPVYRWSYTVIFICAQLALEQWLVQWKVIIVDGWSLFGSLVIQSFVLFFTAIALKWYRRLLRKEGITEDVHSPNRI